MNLLLIILWYLFIGAVVYLFQKETRCFSCWNTFTLFMGFTLLQHGVYIPFCLSYPTKGFYLPSYASTRFISNLVTMYLFIFIGVKFVNLRCRFNPSEIHDGMKVRTNGYNPLLFWSVLVFFTTLLIYTLSVATININFTNFIHRALSAEEYREARILFAESTSRVRGFVFYVVRVASYALFPLLMFTCFFSKKSKALPIHNIVFYSLLCLYLYWGLVSGHKGTSVMMLTGVFICHWIKNRELGFSLLDRKILLMISGLCFALIPYLYMVQYPDIDYFKALHNAWFRLAIEPNRGLQLYYFTYPEIYAHLLGSSSHFIARIYGDNSLPPHTYIPTIVFGLSNNCWNCIFIGNAWADFGFLGTITTSLAVGIILQWYNVWFAHSRKTALVLGTYVALILAASKLSSCGLFTSFLTFGVASSFLAFLILREMRWLKARRK